MLSRAQNRNVSQNCEERASRGVGRLWTNIPPLDDGWAGIDRQDTIAIAGYSGSGKTEIATHIALENASAGRKVYYFALEAYEGEIEERILFKIMSKLFYDDPDRPRVDLNYSDWFYGDLPELAVYDLKAQKIFAEKYKTLFTFYRTKDFTLEDLITEFSAAAADGMELGIVDHTQFFDWGEKSEYQALNEIIKTARDLTLLYRVPMILVSHLRKQDKKFATLAPEPDEIHGTSEIYKRCTKMLLMGSGEYDAKTKSIETFMLIGKNRIKNEATKDVCRIRFSYERNSYEGKYDVGKNIKRGNGEFEPYAGNDIPRWCKSIRPSVGHKAHAMQPAVSHDPRRLTDFKARQTKD